MYEKISKIAKYVREILSKIKWSNLLLLFVILLFFIVPIIMGSYFSYKIYKIYYDEEGPTSNYDWVYFEKNIDIKKDNSNESVGQFHINGVVRSKGIISPGNPAEFMIIKNPGIEFRLKKEFLEKSGSLLCEGFICRNNATINVCLLGFNARGYNKSEQVKYTYLREEPACIENIKLDNMFGNDGMPYVIYYNDSQDFNKEVIFITSGPQSLRIDNFFGYQYYIENVFEVNPYHFYSELQLNKYAFLIALIGLIVVMIQIIDFGLKIYDRLRKRK